VWLTLLGGVICVLGVGVPPQLGSLLLRIGDGINIFMRWIGEVAKWLALALVLIVVSVVIQRYVFGIAFAKLQEAILYAHASLFMLAIAYTFQRDGHVRVDVFLNRLGDRTRHLIDLLSAGIFAMLTSITVILTSRGYIALSWRVLEGSNETSGLPLVYLIKTLIVVFAALLFLQCIAKSCRACYNLIEAR